MAQGVGGNLVVVPPQLLGLCTRVGGRMGRVWQPAVSLFNTLPPIPPTGPALLLSPAIAACVEYSLPAHHHKHIPQLAVSCQLCVSTCPRAHPYVCPFPLPPPSTLTSLQSLPALSTNQVAGTLQPLGLRWPSVTARTTLLENWFTCGVGGCVSYF